MQFKDTHNENIFKQKNTKLYYLHICNKTLLYSAFFLQYLLNELILGWIKHNNEPIVPIIIKQIKNNHSGI